MFINLKANLSHFRDDLHNQCATYPSGLDEDAMGLRVTKRENRRTNTVGSSKLNDLLRKDCASLAHDFPCCCVRVQLIGPLIDNGFGILGNAALGNKLDAVKPYLTYVSEFWVQPAP